MAHNKAARNDNANQVPELLADHEEPNGATTCQHRIRQYCGAICLLPTSASGQWQSFVGNAPIRRNTWALNVNISPTDSGQHTRRLAGIDAQIAVVCRVGGSSWNWEGAGKDFPAAWKEFVGQNKVSHEAICRLSILVGAPPLPESETWTVEEGQLLIASTDGVAITEAAFAFFDFGPKAQISSNRDSGEDISRLRQRLAMFYRNLWSSAA
ncbi:hypothetical protein CcaCcLH18_11996 [Colletotrichum camelliae]|nr:hypothetical protein CcaCcLH18_11996 [Colletotrichum camelliae]